MKCAQLSLIAVSLIFFAAHSEQEVPDPTRQEVVDSVTERVLESLRYLRERDADAALEVYGRLAEYVHIDNGSIVRYDDLQQQMRRYLASVDRNEIHWDGTPEVMVLSSDAAIVYGHHIFAGNEPQAAHRGVWTGVFQRIAGRWKLVHSHSSDEHAQSPGSEMAWVDPNAPPTAPFADFSR